MADDWREVLRERYGDVLLDRLRTTADPAIFEGAADRLVDLIEPGREDDSEPEPAIAVAGLVNPCVRCPDPDCDAVLSLAEFRAHLETHAKPAVTVRVGSRDGSAPAASVVAEKLEADER